MADQRVPELPDESNTESGSTGTGAGETVTIEDSALVTEQEIPAPSGETERPVTGSGNPAAGLANRLRESREQIAGQAGEKVRGLVSQGLERTAEALTNVSKMVGDTVPGIEERLGPEYGDYARRAAGAIDNVASKIGEKDPDELIEDTRNFVRDSPGVALAGAAVVGFVIARLVKTGLGKDEDENENI